MRISLLPIAALLIVHPAFGGETAWQQVAPDVKLRLVSTGQIKASGKILVGLEISMPDDTKTYWRVPGDSGFPMEVDISRSSGVSNYQVLWPYPSRVETLEYIDYAYFGPTLIPIELDAEAHGAVVELDVVLGVCSEICIPAQASFSLPLDDAEPDRVNGLRIRQALAMVPMEWDGDRQPIGNVQYLADEGLLAIHISDLALDPHSLIAATKSGETLFGAPQKSPEANIVLIPALGVAGSIDLENQPVQLTFQTGMGAFEVWRPVEVVHTE